MPVNIKSIQAKLLNLSREKGMDFQLLLNRLGAEQFLFRLSLSAYSEKFIFKGGSLLAYMIDTVRKTKDLDFSIKQFSRDVNDIIRMVQSVLAISVDDGFEWQNVVGEQLNHPEMNSPGVRIACRFLFGHMKGMIRMDIASGDTVVGVEKFLKRIRYKEQILMGEDFSLLTYPPEAIFAEKLQIVLKKHGQNTRMKDYYDLFKLVDYPLEQRQLKKSISETFTNRKMDTTTNIEFGDEYLTRLQLYWDHFLKKERLLEMPAKIADVIDKINIYLEKVYEG